MALFKTLRTIASNYQKQKQAKLKKKQASKPISKPNNNLNITSNSSINLNSNINPNLSINQSTLASTSGETTSWGGKLLFTTNIGNSYYYNPNEVVIMNYDSYPLKILRNKNGKAVKIDASDNYVYIIFVDTNNPELVKLFRFLYKLNPSGFVDNIKNPDTISDEILFPIPINLRKSTIQNPPIDTRSLILLNDRGIKTRWGYQL